MKKVFAIVREGCVQRSSSEQKGNQKHTVLVTGHCVKPPLEVASCWVQAGWMRGVTRWVTVTHQAAMTRWVTVNSPSAGQGKGTLAGLMEKVELWGLLRL